MNLKATAIFDKAHSEMIESTFSLPAFVLACKKIRLFYQFSFEIQSILESHDQAGHIHFWACPTNKFLISF